MNYSGFQCKSVGKRTGLVGVVRAHQETCIDTLSMHMRGVTRRLCASDHAVMFSVSKKLVSVSLTWEGWVAGMDSASGHSTSRNGEVNTASGLPANVGTTRLSGVAKLYGPECGLSSGPALRAFGSRGLGVSTFPCGRMTDTRERRSRHLSFYDPKVEGGQVTRV
ncbi:hypothetical protein CRG98_001892 [Punica granatum]|uniref:Uncharacterized protein n=1 Tax=Punica granatum TaxID=22663 RepID=A0A2I0LAI7_PUNGR|nr:hypothetical protein CRG98_001892 [Punica granatum]